MARIICFILLITTTSLHAQQHPLKWGDELKMNIALIDYEITGSDSTGYYFIEKRINKITPPNSEGKLHDYYKITKFDADLKEVWDFDYFKPLAEFDVFSVRLVNGELVMFITDYNEKEKRYKVYAVPVDKNNGKPAKEKDFKELAGFERGERRDNFLNARLTETKNGFLVIGDFPVKGKIGFTATVLDKNLIPVSNTIINMDADPALHFIHDVKYINGRIIVLYKAFEKKSKKENIFNNFIVSVYDVKGIRLLTMPANIEGKFTLEAKLLELAGNEAAVAGFYSDNRDEFASGVDGFFIGRIDETKQIVAMHSDEYLPAGFFSAKYTSEWEAADKIPKRDPRIREKNKTGSEKDISIRSIDVSPSDGRIIVTAEFVNTDFYEHTTVTGAGVYMHVQTDYLGEVKTEDILLVAADSAGGIKWLKVIPKQQQEVMKDYSINRPPINYFQGERITPYYSSFTSIFTPGNFILLYNDHQKNVATNSGNVRMVSDFEKHGGLFKLNVDPLTGNYSKILVSGSSNDEAITVPHHAYLKNDIMIVPARKTRIIDRIFIKMAKASMN